MFKWTGVQNFENKKSMGKIEINIENYIINYIYVYYIIYIKLYFKRGCRSRQ